MTHSRKRYLTYKEQARALVCARIAEANEYYGMTLRKVFIKNHKSRWGSCSQKGNLNFNYRIVFLPPHLQMYLVVHELCHLAHFNHSEDFWSLVEEAVPEYKAHRREIRRIRI